MNKDTYNEFFEKPEDFHRCESTNHKVPDDCYGEIWKCSNCGKHICYNEGLASDTLCDDCGVLLNSKK